jgi:hypothetical protein
MNIKVGDTVFGAFPVEVIVARSSKTSQINLADHHSVVVAIMGDTLLLAYSGTDADSSNCRRRGFIAFPCEVDQARTAGWKVGSKFFIDAGQLAFVPANAVTAVGKLTSSLLKRVQTRAGEIRQQPLTYRPESAQLVTGASRQDKRMATAV